MSNCMRNQKCWPTASRKHADTPKPTTTHSHCNNIESMCKNKKNCNWYNGCISSRFSIGTRATLFRCCHISRSSSWIFGCSCSNASATVFIFSTSCPLLFIISHGRPLGGCRTSHALSASWALFSTRLKDISARDSVQRSNCQ